MSRFDAGIESEHIGLEGDLPDVGCGGLDLERCLADCFHRHRCRLHHLLRRAQVEPGIVGDVGRVLCLQLSRLERFGKRTDIRGGLGDGCRQAATGFSGCRHVGPGLGAVRVKVVGAAADHSEHVFQDCQGVVEIGAQALVSVGERHIDPDGKIADRQAPQAAVERFHHGLQIVCLVSGGLEVAHAGFSRSRLLPLALFFVFDEAGEMVAAEPLQRP